MQFTQNYAYRHGSKQEISITEIDHKVIGKVVQSRISTSTFSEIRRNITSNLYFLFYSTDYSKAESSLDMADMLSRILFAIDTIDDDTGKKISEVSDSTIGEGIVMAFSGINDEKLIRVLDDSIIHVASLSVLGSGTETEYILTPMMLLTVFREALNEGLKHSKKRTLCEGEVFSNN